MSLEFLEEHDCVVGRKQHPPSSMKMITLSQTISDIQTFDLFRDCGTYKFDKLNILTGLNRDIAAA